MEWSRLVSLQQQYLTLVPECIWEVIPAELKWLEK